MKVPAFSKTGTKSTATVTLDKAVFGRDVTPELLKQAYNRVLANGRQGAAQTKTRGLVAGGGKKPWRQKGTGRARSGSIRNPLWRGGGTIFGPTGEQNYSVGLPKKALRGSVAQALSAQVDRVVVIEDFVVAATPKVKDTVAFLAKLDLNASVLLIVEAYTPAVAKATRNVDRLVVRGVNHLTAYEVLNAQSIVITKPSLEALSAWIGKDGNAK